MKRQLLFLIFALVIFEAKSQIPNASFENWTTVESDYEDPDDWQTFNALSFLGAPATVIKSTDKYIGTYAMKVQTVAYKAEPSDENNTDTIEGIAATSFKVDSRPSTLSGYFKSIASDNDSVGIYVVASKGDDDEFGGGMLIIKSKVSTYTSFSIPLTFKSKATPDSIGIIITSSTADHPVPGHMILVDALTFGSGPEGTQSGVNASPAKLFPNPVAHELNISDLKQGSVLVNITDARGVNIYSTSVEDSSVKVNTSDFRNGMFIYTIADGDGAIIHKGKFIVE